MHALESEVQLENYPKTEHRLWILARILGLKVNQKIMYSHLFTEQSGTQKGLVTVNGRACTLFLITKLRFNSIFSTCVYLKGYLYSGLGTEIPIKNFTYGKIYPELK